MQDGARRVQSHDRQGRSSRPCDGNGKARPRGGWLEGGTFSKNASFFSDRGRHKDRAMRLCHFIRSAHSPLHYLAGTRFSGYITYIAKAGPRQVVPHEVCFSCVFRVFSCDSFGPCFGIFVGAVYRKGKFDEFFFLLKKKFFCSAGRGRAKIPRSKSEFGGVVTYKRNNR